MIEDSYVVSFIKGRFDIDAVLPTNRSLYVVFNENEISFQENRPHCSLSVSTPKGRFNLEAPCNGVGLGKLTALEIKSLGLKTERTNLKYRMENNSSEDEP